MGVTIPGFKTSESWANMAKKMFGHVKNSPIVNGQGIFKQFLALVGINFIW
jgi:hypothetical protein